MAVLDVVVTDGAAANQIWLLKRQRRGAVGDEPAGLGWWSLTGIGDFNGDGQKDVLYQPDASRQYAIYLNGVSMLSSLTVVSGKAVDAVQTLAGNDGIDTVQSSISYTLPGGVET